MNDFFRSEGNRITLAGIKLHPRIGVTAEERKAPQECTADLIVWSDFEHAVAADSLEKSIDYCAILRNVQEVAGERDYSLLETLAASIIKNVLEHFPVLRVRITLRKRPQLLVNELDFVEVTMDDIPKDE